MAMQIPVHEVISGDRLQCDELWLLIREDDGTLYVLYERHEIDPATKAAPEVKRARIAVKTVLAQENELAAKLKEALRSSLRQKVGSHLRARLLAGSSAARSVTRRNTTEG